jgi:hypothetical protein
MGREERSMRYTRQLAGVVTAVGLAVGLWAVPVQATVHEIVAQWCSGHDELAPPGISDGSRPNFARPLVASGVLAPRFDPTLGGILITFDYGHPAVKVQSSGLIVRIGTAEDGTPIFLDVPEPDPSFPAFQHCPRLAAL